MKSRLLSYALALLASTALAQAADFKTSAGIYYFSANKAVHDSYSSEMAEGIQRFHYDRNIRDVASDFAREELQQGNVCLLQVEQDLRLALKEKEVSKLCSVLFKDELQSIQKSRQAITCMANVEAHESTGNTIELHLVLQLNQPKYNLRKARVLASIGRTHIKDAESDWPRLARSLGKPAADWKALLKNGSCSLNEDVFDAFREQHFAQLEEQKNLARCNRTQHKQSVQLVKLQRQFRRYVPDEWIQTTGKASIQNFLREEPLNAEYTSLEECQKARNTMAEQLVGLRNLSAKLASKYEIPALNWKNAPNGRGIASEFDNTETEWQY